MDCKGVIDVQFFFENCESIHVPIECFKSLDIAVNPANMIYELHCHIVDDGSMVYGTTWCDNTTAPITRLHRYNDITSINLEFEDRVDEYDVCWGGEEDWDMSNDRQSSKLLSYKEIEISIENLSDSKYIKDMFTVLDAFENSTTIEDVKKAVFNIDDRKRPYINDAVSLIQAIGL